MKTLLRQSDNSINDVDCLMCCFVDITTERELSGLSDCLNLISTGMSSAIDGRWSVRAQVHSVAMEVL